MDTPQQAVSALAGEGEVLLKRGDYRRALVLFESLLKQAPSAGVAWLGAAEAALELGLGDRAIALLGEAKSFYDQDQVARWVDLKSEALRRFGSCEEGIAFVTEWLDRVHADTRTRLLLRRAAFYMLQQDMPGAQAAAKEAWETLSPTNLRAIPSMANIAFGCGLSGIAFQAGRTMMRSGHAVTGFFVLVASSFWGAHALFVRVPVFLALCALGLVPALRPLLVATMALLAAGLLVTWQRLRPFAISYAVPLIYVLAVSCLGLVTRIRPLGNAIGVVVLVLMAGGAVMASWRGRTRKHKPTA